MKGFVQGADRHKACHQIPRRFSRGSLHGKSFHTAWVKLRRTQYEHLFSGLPLEADIDGLSHVRDGQQTVNALHERDKVARCKVLL
jgi:hypothetical protein